MSLLNRAAAVALLSLTPSCCVARGTRVRTRSGERLIETLVIGEVVECVDPLTGDRVEGRVDGIRVSRRECVQVSAGGETLRCTSDHPLYCPRDRAYFDAGDWVLGARTALLRVDASSVEPVVVSGVSLDAGVDEVFDLTIDHPLHNFVANGLLVHNKSPPCDGVRSPSVGECPGRFCPPGSLLVLTCGGSQWGGPNTCECVRFEVPDEPADSGAPDAGSERIDGGARDSGVADAGPPDSGP